MLHTATDGMDADEFYYKDKKINYYVSFVNSETGSPVPSIRCQSKLDWMKVIIYSVGSGCGLFAIGFISYFILVNVKDYMELREFEKDRKGIWDKGDVMEAEMRKSGGQWRKSIRNRLSVKFTN